METQKNTQETLLARENEKFSTNSKHGILQEALNRVRKIHLNKITICVNLGVFHILGAIGLVHVIRGEVPLSTIIFVQLLSDVSIFGITAGAHHYWCHRSFKARTPLKLLLAACVSFTGQESIWLWSAWHRVHHKFVDTNLDPHNSNRGFFYSHIGWILLYDHEAFKKILPKIDMSDLDNDPIVMIQDKYYLIIHWVCNVIIPTLIPWYLFGDTFLNSLCVGATLRYIYTFHRVMLVNSVAHIWGWRPYDTSINPTENKIVAFFVPGEGCHNYHHVFPFDYKGCADTGFFGWNWQAAVIDFFAWIGWAYDLKSASKDMVTQRVKRTGNHHHLQRGSLGWDDADVVNENILHTEILYPSKEF